MKTMCHRRLGRLHRFSSPSFLLSLRVSAVLLVLSITPIPCLVAASTSSALDSSSAKPPAKSCATGFCPWDATSAVGNGLGSADGPHSPDPNLDRFLESLAASGSRGLNGPSATVHILPGQGPPAPPHAADEAEKGADPKELGDGLAPYLRLASSSFITTLAMSAGDLVLSIPSSLILTSSPVPSAQTASTFQEHGGSQRRNRYASLSAEARLACVLLAEHEKATGKRATEKTGAYGGNTGEASPAPQGLAQLYLPQFSLPYVDASGGDEDEEYLQPAVTSPLLLDSELLEELDYNPIIKQIEAHVSAYEAEHALISDDEAGAGPCATGSRVSSKAFLETVATVLSRALLVDAQPEQGSERGSPQVLVLAPLLDAIPVAPRGHATTYLQWEDGSLALRAARSIPRGAEVSLPLDLPTETIFVRRGHVPAAYAALDRTLLFSSLSSAVKSFEKMALSTSAGRSDGFPAAVPKTFFEHATQVAVNSFAAVDSRIEDALKENGGSFGSLQKVRIPSEWIGEKVRAAAAAGVWEVPGTARIPGSTPEQSSAQQKAARGAEKHEGLPGDAMYAWGRGHVDPRLLAAFAALHYFAAHGKEPPYALLAPASIWLGWHAPGNLSSCALLGHSLRSHAQVAQGALHGEPLGEDIARGADAAGKGDATRGDTAPGKGDGGANDRVAPEDLAQEVVDTVVEAVRRSVRTVQGLLEKLLARFASMLGEDKQLLSWIAVCQGYADQGRALEAPPELCMPWLMDALGPMHAAVRFRMRKKQELVDALDALTLACDARYDALRLHPVPTNHSPEHRAQDPAASSKLGVQEQHRKGGPDEDWEGEAPELTADIEFWDIRLDKFLTWLRRNGLPDFGLPHTAFKVSMAREGLLPPAKRELLTSACRKQSLGPICEKWHSRPSITLYAGSNLKVGTLLVSIPHATLAISLKTVAPEPAPLRGGEVWTLAALAAFILRERARGGGSPWAPCIDMLPAYVPLPLFFPEEILQEIDYPEFIHRVRVVKEYQKALFQQCWPQALAHASEDQFLWALSILSSRSFDLKGTKDPDPLALSPKRTFQGSRPAIVPMADLLDHYFPDQVSYKINVTSFDMVALEPITVGQELFTLYGLESNDELLLGYGFVLDAPQPHDSVQLLPGLDSVPGFVQATVHGLLGGAGRRSGEDQEETGKGPGARGGWEGGTGGTGGGGAGEGLESGGRQGLEMHVLQRAVAKAQAAVGAAREKHQLSSVGWPRYRFGKAAPGAQNPGDGASRKGVSKEAVQMGHIPLYAWPDGIVEPNLVASLAAVMHRIAFGTDASYTELAQLSLHWGWNITSQSEEGFRRLRSLVNAPRGSNRGSSWDDSRLERALGAALAAVQYLAVQRLMQFKSSLEDDELALGRLRVCQERLKCLSPSDLELLLASPSDKWGAHTEASAESTEQGEQGEGDWCKGQALLTLDERDLAVRFRRHKKIILRDVQKRIGEEVSQCGLAAMPQDWSEWGSRTLACCLRAMSLFLTGEEPPIDAA